MTTKPPHKSMTDRLKFSIFDVSSPTADDNSGRVSTRNEHVMVCKIVIEKARSLDEGMQVMAEAMRSYRASIPFGKARSATSTSASLWQVLSLSTASRIH